MENCGILKRFDYDLSYAIRCAASLGVKYNGGMYSDKRPLVRHVGTCGL